MCRVSKYWPKIRLHSAPPPPCIAVSGVYKHNRYERRCTVENADENIEFSKDADKMLWYLYRYLIPVLHPVDTLEMIMAVKLECRGKVGATQECAACGKKIHDRFLLKVRIQDTRQIPPQGQDTGYTTDSYSRSGLLQIQDTGYRIQDTQQITPQGQAYYRYRIHDRFHLKVRTTTDTEYTTDSSLRSGYRIHDRFLLKVRPTTDTGYTTDSYLRLGLLQI
jgi:hypothetical protein